MNPFNSVKVTNLFLFMRHNKLYVSIDGVTFNDLIYSQKIHWKRKYDLEASLAYISNVAKIRMSSHKMSEAEVEYIDYQIRLYDVLVKSMDSQKM